MNIQFLDPATLDEDRVFRQKATVDGSPVECKCGYGVIIQLDDCATKAGFEIPELRGNKEQPRHDCGVGATMLERYDYKGTL